jgi:hypothetical protein
MDVNETEESMENTDEIVYDGNISLEKAMLQGDAPRSCRNVVSPFNEIMKGKITSQVRNAHTYFMTSTDPAAGGSYPERTANLALYVSRTFQEFMHIRRNEYRAMICNYYKTDWNKPGGFSRRTLTCQPGFYLLQETLKRTTNGDWKGGPYWTLNTISWDTGGHGRSETFVDIDAKYHESAIQQIVYSELNVARQELNSIGIPTELPPFLNG